MVKKGHIYFRNISLERFQSCELVLLSGKIDFPLGEPGCFQMTILSYMPCFDTDYSSVSVNVVGTMFMYQQYKIGLNIQPRSQPEADPVNPQQSINFPPEILRQLYLRIGGIFEYFF